ncbi:hypothetical protein TWF718_009832 [Orbilia javanica]|uniref:Uncharacterized protein n=1 Tax=Orbilia javanica TaxID=47235 RepID=A0AAN8RAT8_9PEZI
MSLSWLWAWVVSVLGWIIIEVFWFVGVDLGDLRPEDAPAPAKLPASSPSTCHDHKPDASPMTPMTPKQRYYYNIRVFYLSVMAFTIVYFASSYLLSFGTQKDNDPSFLWVIVGLYIISASIYFMDKRTESRQLFVFGVVQHCFWTVMAVGAVVLFYNAKELQGQHIVEWINKAVFSKMGVDSLPLSKTAESTSTVTVWQQDCATVTLWQQDCATVTLWQQDYATAAVGAMSKAPGFQQTCSLPIMAPAGPHTMAPANPPTTASEVPPATKTSNKTNPTAPLDTTLTKKLLGGLQVQMPE